MGQPQVREARPWRGGGGGAGEARPEGKEGGAQQELTHEIAKSNGTAQASNDYVLGCASLNPLPGCASLNPLHGPKCGVCLCLCLIPAYCPWPPS